MGIEENKDVWIEGEGERIEGKRERRMGRGGDSRS